MEKVKKNKLVKDWVRLHLNDHYVHLATKDNYRSRAAFKLLEIDAKYAIFNRVHTLVDLGCAPGSWLQVASRKLAQGSTIVGLDILPTPSVDGVIILQGDFTSEDTLNQLISQLHGGYADLVISDMAPNLSGVKMVDQARISYLGELVLDFCKHYLINGGNCVLKVFHGSGFEDLIKLARLGFNSVVIYKPEASRSKSSETYLICKDKKSN